MKSLLLLLVLLAARFMGWGQSLWFDRLDVEKGLSQNSVLCVAQDSRGFMWFGTRNGLNKYDSRKITVYKNKPGDTSSLRNNYILSLLCDSRQTLWIGTRDGLHRYNAAADKFERIPVAVATGSAITCLYEDSQKRLWVGTTKNLFLLTNREKPSFFSFAGRKNFPSKGVLCMYEDRSGIIWAGTYDGLVKITTVAGGFEATTLRHDAAGNNSISDNQVTSITQDATGYLWIATLNGGLNRFDARQNNFVQYTQAGRAPGGLINNHIRKLLYDGQDRIWIGTQEGLSILDIHSNTFTSFVNDPWNKNSLSQNSVHSLFKDNTGNIWVGTFFGGVNNCNASFGTGFTVYNNSARQSRLSNNVVSAIVEDDKNNLWIGTEGGGLNYIDRQTGRVIFYQHNAADATSIGSNLVKTIYKDRLGNIWAGTHGGGLNLFVPATNSFKRYLYKENDPATLGAEIPCVLEDSKGIFWIGTETAGIKLFRKLGIQLTPYPEGDVIRAAIGNKAILSLLETAEHTIWVGTTTGLYAITGNQVKLVEEKTGSYPCYVNTLLEDSRGNIWAGTYYNGLNVYDRTGVKIAAYTQEHGLSDNNVLGILQDNNQKDIWVGTANGLARLPAGGGRITIYNEADGLAGNVFNNNACYKSNSGELFLGGYKGFSAFYPDKIKENTAVPPVFITELKLFGRPVTINGPDHILTQDLPFTRGIQLDYNQNVLALDFAILNYVKPEKNNYAYKLEGFDND
ncbi:MAG TPA: two-component regulator propeller domain-containing protein, partial [Niastella sp.]